MHQYTRGDLLDFVIANTLSKEAIARMARQVLRALHYFHSNGFAHRDVKPDNILLTGNDAIPDAHLGDLGYAAERTEAAGGMFLDQVGSKPYMAPELLLNRPYTEAVDMWAFGVLLFIMFTRKMPFPDPDQDRDEWMYRVVAGEWHKDFLTGSEAPQAAYDLIAGCLSVDPAGRPTTAQALESEFFAMLRAGDDVKAAVHT
jgi:serine/threonine protein kinase